MTYNKTFLLLIVILLVLVCISTTSATNTTDTQTKITPNHDISDKTSDNIQVNNEKIKDVEKDTKSLKKTSENKEVKKDTKSLKKTKAEKITVTDTEATAKYGGQISYSFDKESVNEGKTFLYVNNTHIQNQEITYGEEPFTWENGDNNKLNDYPIGEYDMCVKYSVNGTTIESNTAKLTINGKESLLYITNYSLANDNIKVDLEVIDDTQDPIDNGFITASYEGKEIKTITMTNNTPTLTIPTSYAQKTIDYTYTDNGIYYLDVTQSQLLDVTVPGSGEIDTSIDIESTRYVHINNTYKILVNVVVRENQNNTQVKLGIIEAYNKTQLISRSSNTTSILIPSQYNMEDITYKYIGTGSYNNTTITTSTYTPELDAKIYVPYMYGYKNSGVNIYSTITTDNSPVIDGKVDLFINNNLLTTIDVKKADYYTTNGNTTIIGYFLDLSTFTDGEYNVSAQYYDSNVFEEAVYETTLSIRKIGTYLYAYNRTIYKNSTTTLYANIYSNGKESVNDGLMKFTIDGEEIATELVENNTANIEYIIPSTLKEGTHLLLIEYLGTDLYNSSSKEITLTLAKTSTTTSIRTWTADESENIILNTTIKAYNKTINNGTVKVYVDGCEVASSNVENSSALITLPETIVPGKTYNISVKYSGCEVYANSTYENSNYTFNKKTTTVRIYSYLRNNGTLTATGYIYTSNYATLNKGIAQLYIADKLVQTTNVKDNKANFTYNMYDYKAGDYPLEIRYNGTKLYEKQSNTTTITKTEYHAKTYMKLNGNTTYYIQKGKTITLNATLSSYNGEITEDIKATITIDGTDYNKNVTFKNGQLIYEYTIPDTIENGDYKLIIQSYNSTHWRESNASATLKIGGIYTSLYQKNLWGYKQNTVLFNTTINDKNRNQVPANQTIIIKIYNNAGKLINTLEGKTINGKYINNYTLPANMTEDSYSVNITTIATDDYAASSKISNMTLNNRRNYIKVSSPYSYVGKNIVFNGTIIDSITRTNIKANGTVIIQLNATTLTTATLKNGAFTTTYKQTIPAGKHEITYIYSGNNIYSNSTKTGNLTINKNTLKIQTNYITAKIGDNINLTATITDYNNKTITETLKADLYNNGKEIASNITITNGKLNYNYKVETTNNLTLTILENNNYKTKTINLPIKIQKDYQFIGVQYTLIKAENTKTITINGNITNRYKKLITSPTTIKIKIAGKEINNITTTDGKFTYQYTIPNELEKGTYDITLKAEENNQYYYNTKHMSLQVI